MVHGVQIDQFSTHIEPSEFTFDDSHEFGHLAIICKGLTLVPDGPRAFENVSMLPGRVSDLPGRFLDLSERLLGLPRRVLSLLGEFLGVSEERTRRETPNW